MANAPAPQKSEAKAAPVLAPFRSGTQRTLSTDGYTNTTSLSTSAQDLPIYTPSPNNQLRALWIVCQATGTNATNSVAFNGDGPFNAYSSITFQDANEKPIIGPIDGLTLAYANKYFGYDYNGDPRASAIYSTTTGTGSTAGSFTLSLRVPIEIASRDGLGSLQNQSSSSTFGLKLTLNTTANVFSTAPATSCSVQTRILEDGWWKGNSAGAASRPPAAGSTQYITRGTYNSLNGAQQFQLAQGLGYPIRNVMFVNYDVSSGNRSTSDFPDPAQLMFKGTSYWQVPVVAWKDYMSRQWNLQSTTADVANGLDTGVFVLPFANDFSLLNGDEARNGYLLTDIGDAHQFIGTFNANSKLYYVVNYVAPVGPVAALRVGR